ncbi:DUF5667 domain-containing protein [Patescibacteria group bacterium]|nr:DUF5667 domain-containing protein [Patescibacteria group bacterium]
MTEKEIIKSLKQLGRLHQSAKQDPIKERESYDMLLRSFKEMFPGSPKIGMNFYLSLKPVAISLMAFFVIFISGFGLVKASENAVPGQFLYTVKRVAEKTQLVLAFNQSKKTVLRADILTTRLQEAKILAQGIEEGSVEQEEDLNILAQEVSTEIKSLKKELTARVDTFPEDELLYIEDDLEEDNLPVEDGRQIFGSLQGDALARILKEASDYLNVGNFSAALNNIEEAMQYLENSSDPTIEEELNDLLEETEKNSLDNEIEGDFIPEDSSNLVEPQEPITEEGTLEDSLLEEDLSSETSEPAEIIKPSPSLPPASTGEVFQGINIKRVENPDQELQTGLIREDQ